MAAPEMTGPMGWWALAVPLALLAVALVVGLWVLWTVWRGRKLSPPPPQPLVSQAERVRAEAAVRVQASLGRLSAEQAEERLAAVVAAQSPEELRAVLAGLPERPGVSLD